MRGPTPLVMLVAGLPLVASTLWMTAVAVGELAGRAPFAAPAYRNSAEAAAAGDAAAMLRMMRMGDDPTRIRPVRPEFISSQIELTTTLEAAMWSRRPEMIPLLDDTGAIVDDDQRRELACLAFDLGLPDVVEYLGTDAPCVKGAAIARIVARSRPEQANDHD